MLNNFTLLELAKQISIYLKTAFRWPHCFLALAITVNLSGLNGIIEVDEYFPLNYLKGSVIFYIRNLENMQE